jgi:dihydrodipicolinate synthase/N-acetylneuraminate lyase
MPSRPLVPGIYTPTLSFFNLDESQTLDVETHKEHILWMAREGISGFLLQGSTAEAVALSKEEKGQLIDAAREVLDQNGFQSVPLLVGTSAQSTREIIELSQHAAEHGGDYIVVLPPSYFSRNMTEDALEDFYVEVANASPLPLIIYSYPGVCGGLELDSECIRRLARHNQGRIIGIKQTDHNVGKMTRICYETPDFHVFAGASDYLYAALSVGAKGAITGMGNLTPRLCVEIQNLHQAGKFSEALRLQGELSVAEWSILRGGIPGIKWAAQFFLGRGGEPRRPVPEISPTMQDIIAKALRPIMDIEKRLKETAK